MLDGIIFVTVWTIVAVSVASIHGAFNVDCSIGRFCIRQKVCLDISTSIASVVNGLTRSNTRRPCHNKTFYNHKT